MPATEYLRTMVGNHVLNNTVYTSPEDLYVALFTTAPTIEGGGTEVTGGSYTRAIITFTETATDGEFENNSVSISDMPEATVIAIGIYDDETAGDLLAFEVFSPVSVAASDTYPINAGVLTIRFI